MLGLLQAVICEINVAGQPGNVVAQDGFMG
mgnify:FL=1